MTYYVYSTLAADTEYGTYVTAPNGEKVRDQRVVISGGAGVSRAWDVRNKNNFVTLKGVLTIITDEQYEALNQDPVFELHKKNGYIRAEKKEIKVDTAITSMQLRDVSAPRSEGDFGNTKIAQMG